MTGNGHIDIGKFATQEMSQEPIYRNSARDRFHAGSRRRRAKKRSGGVSRGGVMLIKLGVCAGICALFAVLKALDIPAVNEGLNAVGAALDEKNDDETLGKLKFVELPGILEVFAGGDSLTQPIKFDSAALDETGTYLTLSGEPNAQVTVCGKGTVKSIGNDETLGKYIIVSHENDVEISYYGFDAVSVDEGQPVNRLDTLGRLTDTGKLCLNVKKSGAPQNPCEYLGIEIAQ